MIKQHSNKQGNNLNVAELLFSSLQKQHGQTTEPASISAV